MARESRQRMPQWVLRRPRNWHRDEQERRTAGQRAADLMRNGMGSWTFVAVFLAFMGVWALVNSGRGAFDPYPFILLNLFLSMVAGLQGAILLIAAKRQDAVSAALADSDFETNTAAKLEVEQLIEMNTRQQELLEEVLGLLRESGHDLPAGKAPGHRG